MSCKIESAYLPIALVISTNLMKSDRYDSLSSPFASLAMLSTCSKLASYLNGESLKSNANSATEAAKRKSLDVFSNSIDESKMACSIKFDVESLGFLYLKRTAPNSGIE